MPVRRAQLHAGLSVLLDPLTVFGMFLGQGHEQLSAVGALPQGRSALSKPKEQIGKIVSRPLEFVLFRHSAFVKDQRGLRLADGMGREKRPLFLRTAERAQRDAALSQKALLDQPAAHGDYSGLAAGLDAVAAVAELFDGVSDDPEEQRRRMEARQAAENIGALLALAILLTERVLRRRDSQAESEREKLRQAEPEHSSQAEEQSQAETDLDEPEWKEGDALTFEW